MSDPLPDRDESDALPIGERIQDVEPPPDFLAGVQHKIHVRSGGKFYRSRWSTSPISTLVQIVTLAMLLVIVLIWLLSGPVQDLAPEGQGTAPAGRVTPSGKMWPPVKIESEATRSGSDSPGSRPSPPPR